MDTQKLLSIDRGVLGIPITLSCHHDLHVRVYRPGFKTVELSCRRTPSKIQWETVSSLYEQETALDNVWWSCLDWQRWKENKTMCFPILTPQLGMKAADFLATEYERLAAIQIPQEKADSETREQMLDKARWLREKSASN